MNPAAIFDRELLRIVMADVHKHMPGVMPGRHGLTWSGPASRRHYFFQYDEFYWEGRASSASEARALAWQAFIEKHHAEYAAP